MGRLELQPHSRQRGTDPVVQVAAQPSAFLLPGQDEGFAALLEPFVEPQRGDRGCHLVGHRGQDLHVPAVDLGLALSRPGDQPADPVSPVAQLEPAGFLVRVADAGDRPLLAVELEDEGGRPEPQRFATVSHTAAGTLSTSSPRSANMVASRVATAWGSARSP